MPLFGKRENRSFGKITPRSSASTEKNAMFMLTSEFQGDSDKYILF